MTTPAFTPVSERAFRDALRGLPTKREPDYDRRSKDTKMTFSRSLLLALSDDETRPHFCRVHVQSGEARATDGHRLHVEPAPGVPDGDYQPDGTRVGPVEAACFAACLRPEVVRAVEVDRSYRSVVSVLRAEMIGYPRAMALIVPIGPGDWQWHVTVSDAAAKARINGPPEVRSQPAVLTQARPAWWGGADEGPAVYVRASYLLDALYHAGDSACTVGLGAKALDPIVVADGRRRWAVVMPVRQ